MIQVLDTTNKSIQLKEVANGGSLQFTAAWADITATSLTEASFSGTGNSAPNGDAVIVSAPAANVRRVVKSITIHNSNSSLSCSFIVIFKDSTDERIIARGTLAAGATWYSDDASVNTVNDGNKGDITVSGSGATWTINNNAITTAKILDANVTLAKIANITSGNLLGRTSGGSGPVQEITPGTGVLTWLQTPTADNLRTAITADTGTGNLVFSDAPVLTNVALSNSSNGVPLTITNTGTGNSFVVEDESSDATPFIITSDGRILIGTTSGGLSNRMTFSGVVPINNTVSQIMSMIGVFDVGCSFGYGNGTRFSTNAGASLTQITHYGAFQGTFTGSVTNQIAFEVANLTGATNNFGLHSSITAGANRWAVYAIGGADSLFSGQVQFATGSAAAPSLTIQGDVNTGLAQIGGADTISISTGGTERLRAKSNGAIRFIPLTAAPGSPESGDVYYNSTTNKLQVYNGTAWQDCN